MATAPTVAIAQPGIAEPRPARDASIDYLRATLTLMVLAHHSMLAYTTFAHFDKKNLLNSTAPVVDASRWVGFDYLENFNDVFFMSAMFFISGLFVLRGISKAGGVSYLKGRAVRLMLPFFVTVLLLMPVAYYASYLMAGGNMGYLEFWKVEVFHYGAPAGPPWFLWVLMLFDLIAVALFKPLCALAGRWSGTLSGWQNRPGAAFGSLYLASAIAFLSLLLKYKFETWVTFLPPFSMQISRLLLYLVWFLSGALVGLIGLEKGLLAREGRLVTRWWFWAALAVVAYNLLWFVPHSSFVNSLHLPEMLWGVFYILLWLLSCISSLFAFLAMFRALPAKRSRIMDALVPCAYAMYLVHYVFVTWSQRVLTQTTLPAIAKFAIVFPIVLAASWLVSAALRKIPKVSSVL